MQNDNSQADYKNLLDLLAVYTEASSRLSVMELDANDHLLEFVDEVRSDYAKAQQAVTEAEAAIKLLASAHPEWFADKKTIKTPYGQVLSKSVTKLEVPNEEASILLVQSSEDMADELFLRQHTELNLEALEALSDAELKRLRIKRIKDESLSIKPAKTDLGKAVKSKAEAATAA